jgi:hypothetical protein
VELGFGRCFFGVHGAVGGDQKFIQFLAVEGIEGDAGADGERRMFAFVAKALCNALRDEERGSGVGLRKEENELISTIARSDVNFAGMKPENVREAAKRAATH